MAVTAQIRFTQGVTIGTPGVAIIGTTGQAVAASNGDNTDVVRWKWTMLDTPEGSAVPIGLISDGGISTALFTPDVSGGYHLELEVFPTSGASSRHRLCFQVAEPSGRLVPAFDAEAPALNFGGTTRGWRKIMDRWLRHVDRTDGVTNATNGTQNAASTTNGDGEAVAWVRFTGTTPTLNGLAGGYEGRELTIVAGANGLTIADEAGAATAANRIATGSGAIVLEANRAVILRYTQSRWRPVSGVGGAFKGLGWFDVTDYGAVADGVTDNTAAFLAAIEASGDVHPYAGGSSGPPFGGVVYVPPGPKEYYFASDLDITRSIELMGFESHSLWGTTVLKFAPGKGIVCHSTGTSPEPSGSSEGTYIHGFRIICQQLSIPLRANNTAYSPGDRMRLPNDNRFYYECTVGGTSAASQDPGTGFGGETINGDDFFPIPSAGRQNFVTATDGTVTWETKTANGIKFYNRVTIRDVVIERATNAAIYGHGNLAQFSTNINYSVVENVRLYYNGCGVHFFGGDGNMCVLRGALIVGTGNGISGDGGFGIVDASFLGSQFEHIDIEDATGMGIWSTRGTIGASVFVSIYLEDCEPSWVNGVVTGGDAGSGFASGSPHTGFEWAMGWRRMWTQHRDIQKKPQVRWDEADKRGFHVRYTDDDPGYANIAERYYTANYSSGGASDGNAVGEWVTGIYQGLLGERRITSYTASGRSGVGTWGGSRLGTGNFRVHHGEFRGNGANPYFVGYNASSKTDPFIRYEQGVGGHLREGDRFEYGTTDKIGELVVGEGWVTNKTWTAAMVATTYDSHLGGQPTTSCKPTTPNGYTYVATKPGTAHAVTEPTWPTNYLGNGGIVPYVWAPGIRRKVGDYGSPTAANDYYQVTAVSSPDADGYGAAGGIEPAWPGVGTVVDGALTWTYVGETDGTFVDDGTTRWQCVGPEPVFQVYRGSAAVDDQVDYVFDGVTNDITMTEEEFNKRIIVVKDGGLIVSGDSWGAVYAPFVPSSGFWRIVRNENSRPLYYATDIDIGNDSQVRIPPYSAAIVGVDIANTKMIFLVPPSPIRHSPALDTGGDSETDNYKGIVFGSDADKNMTSEESSFGFIRLTSSVLTATRTLRHISLPKKGIQTIVRNDTGQTINFGYSTGTTVAIPTGTSAMVTADGVNAIFAIYPSSGSLPSGSDGQFLGRVSGSPTFGNVATYYGSTTANLAATGLLRTANQEVAAAARNAANSADLTFLDSNSSNEGFLFTNRSYGAQFTNGRIYPSSNLLLGIGSTTYQSLSSGYNGMAVPISGVSGPFRFKVLSLSAGNATLDATQQESAIVVFTGAAGAAFTLTLPDVTGSTYFVINQSEQQCNVVKTGGGGGDYVPGLGGGVFVHTGSDYELAGIFEGHV